jgi:IS30 family transposase
MDPADVSLAKLNALARRLNKRPGKTSNFETPAERFNACVASIGWNRNPKQPFRTL